MKEYLSSPRIWIYVVMIVGGMIWGSWFIYRTMYPHDVRPHDVRPLGRSR